MKITIAALLLGIWCVGLYAQNNIEKMQWKYVATKMPKEWYASQQAAEVAKQVMRCQTPKGGWLKNIPFHRPLDEKKISEMQATGIGGTFDNRATTTEMRFLAKMYAHQGKKEYRQAFLKGMEYIFESQYDNGGWPQFYPVRPGKSVHYSAHITYNDNAMVNVMLLLRDVYQNKGGMVYLELNDMLREKARAAFDKGVDCILNTQIIVDGKPTVWCAQHDENTLKPAPARAYELESFSGDETVAILMLLMQIENPTPQVVNAVKCGVEWMQRHAIRNTRVERYKDESGETNVRLVPAPGHDIWARFYDLQTEKPYVCDRDGVKKESLQEIGRERRCGYSWYVDSPAEMIACYQKWEKQHAKSK